MIIRWTRKHNTQKKGKHNMVDFKRMLKNTSNIEALAAKIAKINKPQGEDYDKVDERFWYPETDKAGNGYAVIRFLPGPAVDGEDSAPFVQYFSHGFQTPSGKWYIENSLTTFDKKDPVGELNRRLWNSKVDEYVAIARKQKRKLSYISNILVLSDSKNPENEGKVFLYRYGKKIFDKISESMFPIFPDKPKVNPFDMVAGANFRLVIRQVEGYRNYDKSEFEAPSRMKGTDAELEKIWTSEYSLADFIAPNKFKTYEELKARLDEVIGCDSASEEAIEALSARPQPKPTKVERVVPKPTTQVSEEDSPPWDNTTTEDDEDIAYFQKLAKGT